MSNYESEHGDGAFLTLGDSPYEKLLTLSPDA